MKDFLVLCATKSEFNQVKEILPNEYKDKVKLIGIGKVQAAINTAAIIRDFPSAALINVGFCGATTDFKIGDVITDPKFIKDGDYSTAPFDVGDKAIKKWEIKNGADITLITRDYVQTAPTAGDIKTIYDMEFSAIFETVKSLAPKTEIHCVKIVSDIVGDKSQKETYENATIDRRVLDNILKILN
ncbi:MAG: hypothetical protein LBM01_02685 [Christensenellaceae bacterium]|jgi:nucleoside phosphorylase|nr:hypothetical protein [Christensenellaceae bacterium]